MSMKFAKENPAVGGLCHLVEAATALSKLVESPAKMDDPFQQQSSEPAVVAERSVISDDENESSKKSDSRSKRDIFPQRLMEILSDASLSDIVTWLPNGRSFVIVRPDVFTETVLPKYLPPQDARGSTKYPSFTRKLNRWGFRQVTRGPDTGAFHHPLFCRDDPQLCIQMVCQRSRDRKQKCSSKTTASTPAPTRNLPPKKRAFKPEIRPILPLMSDPNESKRMVSSASVAVSVDDSTSTSYASCSSNSSVSGTRTPSPPTTVCAQQQIVPTPAPNNRPAHLSKDPSLVAEALRQSEQNERIRVAKAMLYHNYLQALGSR